MSIFSKIKDAIFGNKAAAQQAPAGTAPGAAPRTTSAPPAAAPQPKAAPAAARVVDVEAVLQKLATGTSQQLDWRTSIVDLMKLLNLDSSLTHRKELAKELGYTGDTNDSATMNIWLHKRVMKELAANGGKVPAELMN